jgi:nucleoside-diphosphate-sugar epimerase
VGGNFKASEYLVNSQGTKNVLNTAIQAGVKRFIHISSLAVADEFRDHFDEDETVAYPTKPRNNYTTSKIEAEKAVLAKKDKLSLMIQRPGWLWGPSDKSIIEMFRMIKEDRFRFIGDGNNLTYFTHMNNILQAIKLALEVDDVKSGEIFNITDGVKLTMKDFVNTIASELGKPKITKLVPVWIANSVAFFSERFNPDSDLTRQNVAIMSNNLHFSIKKAEQKLNYKPDQNLKKQIREIIKSGIT